MADQTLESITEMQCLIDELLGQKRHSDALSLLESAISAAADLAMTEPRSDAADDDESNHNKNSCGDDQAIPSSPSSSSSARLKGNLQLKYAQCLVSLQRYEAALYTVESSLASTTAQQQQQQQQQPHNHHHHHHHHSQQQATTTSSCSSAAAAAAPTVNGKPKADSFFPPSQPTMAAGGANTNGLFSNSAAACGVAAAAAAIAGAVDSAPPRSFVEGGREAVARQLPVEAIKTALECALALHDWQRCKLYANSLLLVDPNSTTALCALGKMACANSAPVDAAEYLVRALRTDPFCSFALEMIVDYWLLSTPEVEQLVLSLEFPQKRTLAGEVARNMYLARIPDASVQLISSQGVPLWLRNYHEAVVLLEANDLDGALRCSLAALSGTPIKQHVACLHLSILTQMHETASLFRFAHLLSESFPSSAVSFYAAGCYYYSIGSFERAGRLYSRATDLDPLFAEAWIAYGHCYARLEEGEQALAAYRRAQNLFPGLRQCELFLGIQYARQHSAALALACLENAQRVQPVLGAPAATTSGGATTGEGAGATDGVAAAAAESSSTNDDANARNNNNNNNNNNNAAAAGGGGASVVPRNALSSVSSCTALLLNETAVLYFRSRQHIAALQVLMRAKEALPNKERPADHEVCVLFNLASAFRKVGYYDLAASTYLEFIRLRPQAAVGHCAYGFTLHIQGDLDGAIAAYRTSLALRRDAFCRDLLERALEERHGPGFLGGGIDAWIHPSSSSSSQHPTTSSHMDAADGGALPPHHHQHQQQHHHAPSPIPAALQQQIESLRGPRASSAASTHTVMNNFAFDAALLPPVVHRHGSGVVPPPAAVAAPPLPDAGRSTSMQRPSHNSPRPTISRALSFQ